MTTKEAKKVPIECYLQTLGFSPVDSRKNGIELWYHSPFKNEKTPSFKVDTNRNTWYDFGMGKGGSILDFVVTNSGCNIGEAFNKISASKAANVEVKFKPVFNPKNEGVTIRAVKILQNQALIDYANERKINISIVRKYLLEVYYCPTGKEGNYFALGFKNNADGYEVRNKYFKGCIGQKSISFIEGRERNAVSVFEGFFDFLAALTDRKITRLKTDVIVLNSITQTDKALRLIERNGYTKIFSFLDNDRAGNEATEEMRTNFKGEFCDLRRLYEGFKDYNEKLISSHTLI